MAIGCTGAAIYGAITNAGYTYPLSCLAAAAAVVGLEANRLVRCPRVPWWVVQTLTLPWVALVIVPWTARVAADRWQVGVEWEPVGLGLPLTWWVNLLALVGFAVGTLVMTCGVAAVSATRWPAPTGRVRAAPAAGAFTLIVLAFLASYVVAGRPFGALWRLSGEYFYSQAVDTRTSFGPLDLAPTVAVAFVVALAGLRRGYRRSPTAIELIALALTILVTLGSGIRSRFLLLVLGWVFVQCFPPRSGADGDRPANGGRPVAVMMCGIALTGSFVGLGLMANARGHSGAGTASNQSLVTAVDSLDVIGSSELLVARGAQLGSLHGVSYTELPSKLVPKIATAGQKQKATVLQLVDDHLDPRVGYSAPYWMESALNFGPGGTLIFCFVFAAALVRTQLAALSSRRRIAQVHNHVGPVVLLLTYELISRLSSEQLLFTAGSWLFGAWLASRAVPDARGMARSEPRLYRVASATGSHPRTVLVPHGPFRAGGGSKTLSGL